jgi:diamine N-acetyltransferase
MRVAPEKLHWVASFQPVAAIMLAKSYLHPEGQVWHPLAIFADELMVGVVAISVDDESTGRPAQTAVIHHFLIDESQQGKGFGRRSITALFEWLRESYPTVVNVGLGVVEDNAPAFHLYESFGFESVGRTLDDQNILFTRLDS